MRRVVDWYFEREVGTYALANECARRGLAIPSMTILRWIAKFGPSDHIDKRLAPPASPLRWRITSANETANGEPIILWRAVGPEGLLLDWTAQRSGDPKAAEHLLHTLMEETRHAAQKR